MSLETNAAVPGGPQSSGPQVGVAAAASTRHPVRRLLRSVPGAVGSVLAVVLLLLAIIGWFDLAGDPLAQNPAMRLKAPSAAHWFGTDQFGREVFARTVSGLANSLQIAVVAVAISAVVGTLAGLVGGYFRRATDAVVGGVANVLFAFPPLLLALTLASVLERNWFTVAVAIAVVYVPIFYRVVRGPVLSLRGVEFVRAAVSTGQNSWSVIFRHVLPNITPLIVVQVALSLSWAVLTEASLSFLGLGTPPPAPSLGSMIFEARTTVTIAPWTMIAPGIIVIVLICALNLLGDGLRDVLDPRER